MTSTAIGSLKTPERTVCATLPGKQIKAAKIWEETRNNRKNTAGGMTRNMRLPGPALAVKSCGSGVNFMGLF